MQARPVVFRKHQLQVAPHQIAITVFVQFACCKNKFAHTTWEAYSLASQRFNVKDLYRSASMKTLYLKCFNIYRGNSLSHSR